MREIIPRDIEVGAGEKPLRPTPNIITAGDLRDYVNLLSPLIDSLNDDVNANVSGLDPAGLEEEAKILDAKADEYEKSKSPLSTFMAKKLRDTAAERRKLAAAQKGLSAKQLADRTAFRIEWTAFYARWIPIAERFRSVIFLTSGGDWTTLQGYDLEYQSLRAKYEGLGLKATMGVPPAAPDIPGAKIPDTLKTVATIAALGVGAYVAVQIFKK